MYVRVLLALIGLLGAVTPRASLAAEYRENMPTVMDTRNSKRAPVEEAAPPTSQSQISRSFQAAYRKVGEPRIAVFWNRVLSDQLSEWVTSGRVVVSHQASLNAKIEDAQDGNHSLSADAERSSAASYQHNVGQDGRRGVPMSTLANAEFQAGFSDPMLRAGSKLVDRSTIMRITHSSAEHGGDPTEVPDAQIVEVKALEGFADYIAEITMLPDGDALGQRAFQVVVKRIPDGLIVAQVVARGRETSEKSRTYWKATSDGYVQVTEEQPVSAESLGRAVAFETMQALAHAWR